MVEEIKQEELQRVLEQNKIVIVDAWAPWCPPCRRMGEVFEEYQEYHPEHKLVKINVDENPEFSKENAIRAIPTILIYRKGKLVGRLVGFRDIKTLEKEVKEALEK